MKYSPKLLSPIKIEPCLEVENIENSPKSNDSIRNDFDEFGRDDEDYFRMGI